MKEPSFRIRAISLDAMGTLIDLKKPPQEIYYEILLRLGHGPQEIQSLIRDPGLFRRYWQEAERSLPPAFLSDHVDRFAHYQETPFAFWGLIFQVMFADLHLPPEQADAAVEVAYHRFAEPDLWIVEPTFGEFAGFCKDREIALFVTSNWDFRLPKILQTLGVASFFREIITSALVGFEKPSAKIFRHLVNAAGCPPSQILHVGDRLGDDARGAQEAGLQAALYRKGAESGETFPFPRFQNLKDICAILNGV